MTERPDTSQVSAWAPLRIAVFRSLWLAALASNVGGWMQLVAAQWEMTELTDDPALVALLSSAAALPTFLLALPAGALADTLDRRRLVLGTQAAQLVVAATLAALTVAGARSPALLLVATVALATATVLGLPAFTAVTPLLVPREQLGAAISLSSITTTLSQALGPALGGVLVAAAGAGAVFAINAASFLGVLVVVARWRPAARPAGLPSEHVLSAVRTGTRYLRGSQPLRAVLVRCIGYLLGYAGLPALLAVFTRSQLEQDASAYGLLLAALGLGGVAGAVVLPGLRRRLGPDRVLALASLAYAAAIAVTARVESLASAVPVLLAAGFAGVLGMASLNIAAQSVLPDWVRGRGLAILQLTAQGTFAVGAAAWGAVASATTVPTAMTAAAAVLAATTLLAVRYRLGDAERVDVSPARRLEPFDPVASPPGPEPVEISVQYRVPEPARETFLAIAHDLRALRRREGGFAWRLTADLSDPVLHTERFVVGSWDEHLRSAQRLTADDQRVLDRLVDLHDDPRPPSTHAARHLRPAPTKEP